MKKSKRVTKSEWLSMALEVFERSGIDAVRIEELARQLGIAKSGFYWHFKDRPDLLSQMLEYWTHEYTEVVIENPDIKAQPPEKRLELLIKLVKEYELNRLEASMIVWSGSDPKVKEVLDDVYKKRLTFIRNLFSDMGFKGNELEMRSQLLTGYMIAEHSLSKSQPDTNWESQLELITELLTKQ
jgi:AcrR family transcriptional regulator